MKKAMFRKVMCFILSLTTLFSVVAVSVSAGALKPESTAATLDEMEQLVGTKPYSEYLAEALDAIPGLSGKEIQSFDEEGNLLVVGPQKGKAEEMPVKVSDSKLCIDSYNSDPTLWVDFDWDKDAASSVYLPAQGSASWNFTIEKGEASRYNIKITYFSCVTGESSVSSIERKLFIDGRAPFSEASYIKLPKQWGIDYDPDNKNSNVIVETFEAPGEKDGYTVEYPRDSKGYSKIVTEVKDGKKTVTKYLIIQDINGNSMAPELVQSPGWSTYYCQDSTGFYHGYFEFYFLEGTHTLTLEAERDPVIIKSIELVPVDDDNTKIPTYEEYLNKHSDKEAPKDGQITILQAEFPDYVSDSSVYATNDNSSAANYPSYPNAQVYNAIGENSYSSVGQWAAYKFKVSESGMYKLSMRFKQSALQGMYACRAIKLSGGDYGLEDGTAAAPFLEAYNTQFDYNKNWQSKYLGDVIEVDGKKVEREFEFYFEADTEYTVYIECSLGTLKDLIKRVSDSLEIINNGYLRVIQLTGTDPDENRTYNFLAIMPEVLIDFCEQAAELEAVKKDFEELCGTDGSHIATLHTIALLLDKMGKNEGMEIAANMATLKSYLGTLGTWINNSQTSTVIVDSISVCPADAGNKGLRPAGANFFYSIGFEIASFFTSFFTDYNAMGLRSKPDADAKTIDVWLATGRDQSQIWRTMIDASESGFTDQTGVAVNLKLVTGGTLLPSILSGKGPDVYIGLGSADVINYAIREAIIGVSGNDINLDDATNSIFTSNHYTYKDGKGNYYTIDVEKEQLGNLVSTEAEIAKGIYKYADVNDSSVIHTIPVAKEKLVARTFVTETFEENTVTVEETVEAEGESEKGKYVQAAMDTITLGGTTYGVPQTMSFAMMFYRMDIFASLGAEVPDTWDELLALLPVLQSNNMEIGLNYASAIDFMLYQNGGNMWKLPDDPVYAGYKIDLDSDIALKSFQYVCRLYSDYSLPISFDAPNRFRTGEMPIVIGDYAGTYNTLVVYATEIAGLWEFTSLPGVWDSEKGELNYDSIAGVGAIVLLSGCDPVLESWQFVQWQTDAKIQASYGNKMVALIGPSAKYESANVQAIGLMSWTASEREAIELQMSHLSSVVNYPGSYIIARYTKFAFLDAVNNGADAVEALQGYVDAINKEIERKRKEFDLPIELPEGYVPESGVN